MHEEINDSTKVKACLMNIELCYTMFVLIGWKKGVRIVKVGKIFYFDLF